MRKSIYLVFSQLLLLGFLSQNVHAQRITVNGNWTLDLRNEITEAGSDYIGTYTSAANQSRIRLRNLGPASYSVSVRYTPFNNWNNSIALRARRTANGNGSGTITGGTVYQIITTMDTAFFTGTRNRRNINIQYELSGVSVTIPVITTNPQFRARILYTLTTP